jgi:hypothetical protein
LSEVLDAASDSRSLYQPSASEDKAKVKFLEYSQAKKKDWSNAHFNRQGSSVSDADDQFTISRGQDGSFPLW